MRSTGPPQKGVYWTALESQMALLSCLHEASDSSIRKYYERLNAAGLQARDQDEGFIAFKPPERASIKQLGVALSSAEVYFWSADLCHAIVEASAELPRIQLDGVAPVGLSGWYYFDGWLPSLALKGQSHPEMVMGLLWYIQGSQLVIVEIVSCDPSLKAEDDPDVLFAQSYYSLSSTYSDQDAAVRFVVTSWLFLAQEVITTVVSRPPRFWRRAQRFWRKQKGDDRSIRIVVLRRTQHAGHQDNESRDVEWACQWLVRGYWRRRWSPSQLRYQPVWVRAHIKGPADKPLKTNRTTLYAVVR
jgi:hypothetical protein